MLRKLFRRIFVLAMLVAPAVTAFAGDPMKDAIQTLPSDAIAMIVTPSLKQLDADYKQAVVDLGLQGLIQPPYNSLTGALKAVAPQLAGLDENGTVAIVLLPPASYVEIDSHLVVVLPVTDPKALLEGMNAKAGEGNVWDFNFYGQPSFGVTADKRLYICKTADVAKKVAAAKPGLPEKLKDNDLKSLDGLDVALWFDGEKLLKMLKPQIDGFMPFMMMAMGGTGDPFAAKQMESMKKDIDSFVEGVSTFSLGVGIEKSGVDLRMNFSAKPGTEFGKQLKVRTTKDSLFKGLPGENYVLAVGQVADPSQAKQALDAINPYIDVLAGVEGIDKDKVSQLRNALQEWMPLVTHSCAKVEVLPPGEYGIIGVSAVAETSDGKKWMELTGKMFDTAKSLVTESKNENIDDEMKKALKALTYKVEAETVGGAKVAQLKFDFTAIDDLDDDEKEEITKVLGKDGLTFRLAALDSNQIVFTFGGGPAYMEKVVQSAAKKEATLDANAGIKKVAANIPAERQSVIYVALDETLKLINELNKATDEDELPVKIPAGTPPLAMTATGGDEWIRMDIFLPTELIVAGKNAVMTLTGGAAPAATTELPTGSDAKTASAK